MEGVSFFGGGKTKHPKKEKIFQETHNLGANWPPARLRPDILCVQKKRNCCACTWPWKDFKKKDRWFLLCPCSCLPSSFWRYLLFVALSRLRSKGKKVSLLKKSREKSEGVNGTKKKELFPSHTFLPVDFVIWGLLPLPLSYLIFHPSLSVYLLQRPFLTYPSIYTLWVPRPLLAHWPWYATKSLKSPSTYLSLSLSLSLSLLRNSPT